MESFSLCRTCLSQSSLNPLFVDSSDQADYSHAIFITTGIKVEPNDGLPQKMCTDCVAFLQNCLKFRQKCKDAEISLLNMKKEIELNQTFIKTEDVLHIEISIDMESKVEIGDEDDKPLQLLADKSDCESLQDMESKYDFPIKTVKYETEDNGDQNKQNVTMEDVIIEHTNGVNDSSMTESFKKKGKNVKTKIKSVSEPLYEVLTEDKKRVMCRLCQKELSIRSIYDHISRRHPEADNKRVKCELCDRYVNKAKMNRHIELMHASDNFKCGYCVSELGGRAALAAHVAACPHRKTTPGQAGRQLAECPVCRKRMQRDSLRQHTRVQHRGLGPVCEHCGRRFGNRRRLLEHLRARHGREPLRCAHCDYRTAGRTALTNHLRLHSGERPFVCEACGARFHADYLLARHRHSHRTQKQVQCDQCPATFKANNSLHSHRLSVHGAARYRCGACGRAFRCRQYAVRHARRAHAPGPLPPVTREDGDDTLE